ncbi:hypothetical protein BT69DRAFT_408814 [Atractiella rhizophila]|nr:hypothetical protein BT69DRAFT_408814 [Atractiella rhizophila]
MKFGKQLQSQRIPGWANHYVDYKGLKKVINNLSTASSNSPTINDAASEVLTQSPLSQPPVSATSAIPAAPFFFKVERELDRINHFYALKQSELQMRLRTLVEKRKVLARGRRGVRISKENSGWLALYEGFKNFERDLARFQVRALPKSELSAFAR